MTVIFYKHKKKKKHTVGDWGEGVRLDLVWNRCRTDLSTIIILLEFECFLCVQANFIHRFINCTKKKEEKTSLSFLSLLGLLAFSYIYIYVKTSPVVSISNFSLHDSSFLTLSLNLLSHALPFFFTPLTDTPTYTKARLLRLRF